VRLGEICEFVETIALSRSQLQADHGVGCIHYGDIHTKFNDRLDCSTIQLPMAESGIVVGVPRLKTGDLVIADASEDMKGVGKGIEILGIPENGVVAGLHTAVLRPQAGLFAKGFLGQLQHMPKFKEQARVLASGLKVYGLSKTSISKIFVEIPPLREQEAIAEALSDADAAIESLDALISKKRDVKQAAMQQLLTGRTRLPGFTADWKEVRLGEHASFFKGNGLSKSQLIDDGPQQCVHYGELFTHYGPVIETVTSKCVAFEGSFKSLAGDVLMPGSDVTPRGLATASAIKVSDVVLGGDVIVIRTKPTSLYGPFLSNFIRMSKGRVLRLVKGSTVYHIHAKDLADLEVLMPPLKEQGAIAEALSAMDDELEALTEQGLKLRMVKVGMMQDLLTGKVRLV